MNTDYTNQPPIQPSVQPDTDKTIPGNGQQSSSKIMTKILQKPSTGTEASVILEYVQIQSKNCDKTQKVAAKVLNPPSVYEKFLQVVNAINEFMKSILQPREENKAISSLTGKLEVEEIKAIQEEEGLTGLSPEVRGKHFEMHFSDDKGNLVATETADRIDSIPLLINGLRLKIDDLQSKRDVLLFREPEAITSDIREKIEAYETEINNNKEMADNYERIANGATWVSTSAPHALFKNSASAKEARQNYVPGLTNLRIQTVVNSEGKKVSSILRSGAITDFSHGEISLQELQDYNNLTLLRKNEPLALSSRDCLAVAKRYDLLDSTGHQFNLESPITYRIYMKKVESLLQEIEDKISASYIDIKNADLPIKIGIIEKLCREREERLSLQFLQDLHAHFKNRPAEGSHVVVGRSSLVDMEKKPIVENSGLMIYERSEGLDMKAIYDKMEGKKILFDLNEDNGAYIDDMGKIHMPKALYKGSPPSEGIELKTFFCNIRVQGKIKNEGLQKVINDECLDKLDKFAASEKYNKSIEAELVSIEEVKNEMKASLQNLSSASPKGDPFDAALHFQRTLDALGGYGSVNCYGGVDRTGYLSALKTHHVLESEIQVKGEAIESDISSKLLKKWGFELLGDHGIAKEVGKDNKNHRGFKLLRWDLKLYSTGTLEGKAKRLDDWRRALFISFPGIEKRHVKRADQISYLKNSSG